MKKLFLFATLLASALVSCDNTDEIDDPLDRIIWDFTCWNISLDVTNQDGVDLLDKNNPENLLEGTTVTYSGKTFVIEESTENKLQTKALMPAPLALQVMKSERTGKYHLLFGEFTPVDGHEKETFNINWGDGTTTKIEFDLYITGDNKNPVVHKILYVDGQKTENEYLMHSLIK